MSSSGEKAIGIKQFKGEGFEYWKFRVETFLEMKGVKHCLSEEICEDATNTKKRKFAAKDATAKHYIVSFIADEHLKVVQEKKTAKQMWEALEKTFGAVSQPRKNIRLYEPLDPRVLQSLRVLHTNKRTDKPTNGSVNGNDNQKSNQSDKKSREGAIWYEYSCV